MLNFRDTLFYKSFFIFNTLYNGITKARFYSGKYFFFRKIMIVVDNVKYEDLNVDGVVDAVSMRINNITRDLEEVKSSFPSGLSRQIVELRQQIKSSENRNKHYTYVKPAQPVFADFEEKLMKKINERVEKHLSKVDLLNFDEFIEQERSEDEAKIERLLAIKKKSSQIFDLKKIKSFKQEISDITTGRTENSASKYAIDELERESINFKYVINNIKNELVLLELSENMKKQPGNNKEKLKLEFDDGTEENVAKQKTDFSEEIEVLKSQLDTTISKFRGDLESVKGCFERVQERSKQTRKSLNEARTILNNIVKGLNGTDESCFDTMDAIDLFKDQIEPDSVMENCRLLESKARTQTKIMRQKLDEATEIVKQVEERIFKDKIAKIELNK